MDQKVGSDAINRKANAVAAFDDDEQSQGTRVLQNS